MTKNLIIIRGVPGSGKTTLAKIIANNNTYEHVEADAFFIDPLTKEYKWDGSKISQAHRSAEYAVNEAMKNSKNIIVSNTFVKMKDMQVYIEMAEQYGYQVQEIICKGRFKNVHGVAEEKVEAKRKAFEY